MTSEIYESQRKRALMRRSADLGLSRAPGRPVWGVVMETGEKDAVTTLVATDDGAASLLTSTGSSVSLTQSEWPYSAGTRFIGSAGDFVFESSPAWAYPLPENGMVRFYLLTFDGVLTAEAPLAELVSGKRRLSDLYYAGHDVSTLVKLVSADPDWRSYVPAAGPAVTPPQVLAELPGGAPPEVPAAVPGAVPAAVSAEAASGGEVTARSSTDEAPPTEPSPTEPPPAQPSPAEPPATGPPPAEASGGDLLLRAAARNDVDEVGRLLAQGYDSSPNARGITPLMAAAHAGALEPLRLLLAAGVPVDTKDGHGYTALMLASNAGHSVCVRLLLGAGADIEARDGEGFRSLMFAAKNGHDDIVRILMERGADPAATNDSGVSAVSLATQNGHTQTASVLLGGYELPRLGD